jgi:carboxylesterase
MEMSFPHLIPTAEPFFLPGDSTGCLLVHGFTGTPKEMRWLGEYLNSQGHTVLGVRLAGHAIQPKDMVRMRWWDWLASVEDGWSLLSECTERVFVIGLSLGGVLALLFASDFPVAGVVAMATPYQLPRDFRVPFIKPLSFFKRSMPKGDADWHDPTAAIDHVSYPADPSRSYAEIRDVIIKMQGALQRVTAPALLVYSKNDSTVQAKEGHAESILAGLGSQEKQLIWVENSGHVIVRDAARQEVFQAVGNFIHRVDEGRP